MNKLTVTIGIPAFNEAANIGYLLKDLLSQKTKNFVISKIQVASDGSSDKTVEIAKGLKSKKIDVLDFKDRQGRAARQTFMMKNATTDIFILLDADMVIPDPYFVEKLLKPMRDGNVDLVSGNLQPLEPENFFEKILYVSMDYKRRVFTSFKDGDNLFTCYGPMRAFSKQLYSKIEFNMSVAEDMYSFFYCKASGMAYAYANDAIAYFKLPTNVSDYRKQSTRYWVSSSLYDEFGKDFIESHYYLPKKLFLTKGFETFLKHPIHAPLYPFLPLITRIESMLQKEHSTQNNWTIAASSKVARGNV